MSDLDPTKKTIAINDIGKFLMCCDCCQSWQDMFTANGWEYDDNNVLSWGTHTGSVMTFGESGGVLTATRVNTYDSSGGNTTFQGPRLLYPTSSSPNPGVKWDLEGGYKATMVINVDEGNMVIGDGNAGLLFDAVTNKAYPVTAFSEYYTDAQIMGAGFDFNPSEPFDITLTKCRGINAYDPSGIGRNNTCHIDAEDSLGNTIDYRFMSDNDNPGWTGSSRRTLKLDAWALVDGNPITSTAKQCSGWRCISYPVLKGTPSITLATRPTPSVFNVHSISMSSIGNLYRGDTNEIPVVNTPLNPADKGTVASCEIVPEWIIDGWVNPYQIGGDVSVDIFGSPGTAVNSLSITCSGGSSSQTHGTITTSGFAATDSTYDTRGFRSSTPFSVPITITSGGTTYDGDTTTREVRFESPNSIRIVDYFLMDNGEQVRITYWYEIGSAGKQSFPVTLDDPFFAKVETFAANPSLPFVIIDAEDAWADQGSKEWLIDTV